MADDYARAIARVAVAQIADTGGFDSMQESSVEVLSELLLRYISEVCTSSHAYAELGGRSEPNVCDTILALEDLGTTVDELHQYARLKEHEVPFWHTIAEFPVKKLPPLPPSFLEKGEEAPKEVPAFLPAFPDPHTYQQTESLQAPREEVKNKKKAPVEAKHQGEGVLLNLHQRFASTTGLLPSTQEGEEDINPFLIVPPLLGQATEKGDPAPSGLGPGAHTDPSAVKKVFGSLAAGDALLGTYPQTIRDTGGGPLFGPPQDWSTGTRHHALALASRSEGGEQGGEQQEDAYLGSRKRKSRYDPANMEREKAEEILRLGGKSLEAEPADDPHQDLL